ncbi:MAG: hypothetical protein AAGH40_03520 [Verrucomicrobiota bacterium]
MKLSNITWEAGSSTDIPMLNNLPKELHDLVADSGGFIVHHGAIHFRGCTEAPKWNSIREVYWGDGSLKMKYPQIDVDDIPFAHDQVGDFYLWRNEEIFHLDSETGDVSRFEHSFDLFIKGIEENIEEYLQISLDRRLEPGRALHVYPPFCTAEASDGVSMRDVSVEELIEFHADFAKQIRDIPEGGKIPVELTE